MWVQFSELRSKTCSLKFVSVIFQKHSWVLWRISANWRSHRSRHLGLFPVHSPSGQAGYTHLQQLWAWWLHRPTKQKGEDYIKENTTVNNRAEGKSTNSKATKPTQEELLLSQCCPLAIPAPLLAGCRGASSASPSPGLPMRGSVCAHRHSVPAGMKSMRECSPDLQLSRASCRRKPGLGVVWSVCCKSGRLWERGAVPMTQLCLSLSWLWPPQPSPGM